MKKEEQTTVPVPRQKLPDPKLHQCNWCDETASNRHEIRKGRKHLGTQMYIFTCHRHKKLGEQAVAPKPREPKL